MMTRNFFVSSLFVVLTLNLWTPVLATPARNNVTDAALTRRNSGAEGALTWAGLILKIINLFEKQPWDTESGNCVIEVKEAEGGHCVAASSPAGDAAYTTYDNWNVCFLNGQQYFEFPDAPGRPSIGKVMIEYTGVDCGTTENGGYATQGLCKPRLTLFEHDQPIVIDMWQSTGNEYDNDNVCHFEVFDNYWNSWKCGVPCRGSKDLHLPPAH